MRIFAIFGPPGTGKTRRLSDDCAKAAETYGEDRVMICSLTRTAAATIRSRVEIPAERVGTLHSACFKGMGQPSPKLATAKDVVSDWNERFPHWRISPQGSAKDGVDPLDDSPIGEMDGDALLEQASTWRHRKTPLDLWQTEAREFHHAWEAWKVEQDVIDFTDMIANAVEFMPTPPGDTACLIVDEAQDLSPLETDVIRNWSRHTKTTLMAGDPDQWLYEWRGAVPELFLPGGLPPEQMRTLSQSYRVPRAPQAEALRVIRECSNRIDVAYRPTEAEGDVRYGSSFRQADELIELALAHTEEPNRGSLMMIAPCSFTLARVVARMREDGIPFHNPYRLKAGQWNPLAAREGATTMGKRIVAFTKLERTGQPWTAEECRSWIGLLSAKVLARNVKAKVADEAWQPPQTREDLLAMFADEGHAAACVRGDLAWLEAHALDSMAKRLEYPLRVARRWGAAMLGQTPRAIVGTVHSVKGGEADVVALAPDLGPSALEEQETNPDSIRRLMYVGMTRTRRELILCAPSRRGQEAGLW